MIRGRSSYCFPPMRERYRERLLTCKGISCPSGTPCELYIVGESCEFVNDLRRPFSPSRMPSFLPSAWKLPLLFCLFPGPLEGAQNSQHRQLVKARWSNERGRRRRRRRYANSRSLPSFLPPFRRAAPCPPPPSQCRIISWMGKFKFDADDRRMALLCFLRTCIRNARRRLCTYFP